MSFLWCVCVLSPQSWCWCQAVLISPNSYPSPLNSAEDYCSTELNERNPSETTGRWVWSRERKGWSERVNGSQFDKECSGLRARISTCWSSQSFIDRMSSSPPHTDHQTIKDHTVHHTNGSGFQEPEELLYMLTKALEQYKVTKDGILFQRWTLLFLFDRKGSVASIKSSDLTCISR